MHLKLPRLPLALGFLASTLLAPHSASAGTELIISVPDQQLAVIRDGLKVATFPVSTSKFGIGDRPSSFSTPIGAMEVAQKIGAGAPPGAVFRHRQYTGEVLRPNTPGRDPIVTRILHLRGLEAKNSRAFDRGIYIHGTPEEKKIGRPASYGCIRMKSRDVIRVFDTATVGTRVEVVNTSLGRALRSTASDSHGSNRAS
jgi:lipoprotein-anchoring transpeptidase ErfK/SrfK